MTPEDENLSTEHQPKGSARNLSDTRDRRNEEVDPGQRQWAADSNHKPTDAENPQEHPERGPGDNA